MMMELRHRSQVEAALQRSLTDDELVVVADLAALSPLHFDVVTQIYRRDPFAAINYLLAVTDDIDVSTVRRYVLGFDELLAQRDPNRGLLIRRLYESKLGRALTADEMVDATSLESITRVQRSVARALAVKDRSLAASYLRDLVPSASWQDSDEFLDSLPGAE